MVTKGMLCFCGAVLSTALGYASLRSVDCPTETAAPQMSPVFINFAARNKANGLRNMISMYTDERIQIVAIHVAG